MKNLFAKITISVAGGLAVVAGVLGLKIQKDRSEAQSLRENLAKSLEWSKRVEQMMNLQAQLEANRIKKTGIIDQATVGQKTETRTQNVVIPGKVVPQTTTKKTSTS